MITFDGPNKLIYLDPAQLSYTDVEIYSRAIDWIHAGGAVFHPPFVQSDAVVLPSGELAPVYTVLQNQEGWRIMLPENDFEYVVNGNMIAADGLQQTFLKPVGFSPNLQVNTSDIAIINVGGGSGGGGLTAAQNQQLTDLHSSVELIEFMYKIHAHKRSNDGSLTQYWDKDGNAIEFEFDDNGQSITPRFVPVV